MFSKEPFIRSLSVVAISLCVLTWDADIVGEQGVPPGEQSSPGSVATDLAASHVDRDESPTRSWRRSETSVALVQGGNIIWQFNYAPSQNTTYFHPVGLPDGRVLSWDQPPDHTWHHGIWFSWKYINGVNYWEHDRHTGKPHGRTVWSDVCARTHGDDSAVISLHVAYHPADDDQIVLRETRRIEISAPDVNGTYQMDWKCAFTAGDREVVLDRTPPQEQAWGGYAGLSVRFADKFTERQATHSGGPAEFGEGNRHRGSATAMEYSGLIADKAVGLAFLDHPRNRRHPTKWYAIRSPVMSYLNAALLSDEPLKLAARERLTLRYRLIIHPNRWDAEQLRAAHKRYGQSYEKDQS